MTTKRWPLSLILQRLRRRPAVELDPADMGTCFGLEMTLDLAEPPQPIAQPATFSRHAAARAAARKPLPL